MHLVDMPSEGYYEILAESMRKRHPEADATLLEHLVEVEVWLDISIVSGFSLGAHKTKNRIAQHEVEFLGDVV